MPENRLIRAARVLDGTGQVFEAGAVLVEGDRVVAVDHAARLLEQAPDAEQVDCGDRTIVPGLIDAHLHLFRSVRYPVSDAELLIRATRGAKDALQAGLTTVRDLGTVQSAIFDLKSSIDRGLVPGPRIVSAGAAIAMSGGHSHGSISTEADGLEGVARAARLQLKQGATVIKLMATGGTSGEHEHFGATQLTRAELRAGVEVAHTAGRPAAIHALNEAGARNAVEAGADSIEHGALIDDETLALMVDRNVTLVPTVGVYEMVAERGLEHGVAAHMVAAGRQVRSWHFETFCRALRAGVRVVFGTDATSSFLPPGDIEPELRIWQRAGLSGERVLRAMTRDAAELLQLGDRVGTLAPGKFADLVVVDGNPLDEVLSLARPWRVMKGGRFVRADWADE